MRNDEFDERMREFFAGAPRPAAPSSLSRLPVLAQSATLRLERVRAGRATSGRWPAGLAVTFLVVAIAVAAVSLRPGAPTAPSVWSNSSAGAVPTAAPVVVGSPYALDGLTWQEVGIGAFGGGALAFYPIDHGSLVVGWGQPGQMRLWQTEDGVTFRPLDASAFAIEDPANEVVFINSIVKGPAGYVAAGELVRPSNGGDSFYANEPVTWRSRDGLRWDRLTAGGLPPEMVSSLAATGDGYVLTVGPTDTNGTTTYYPSYTSADGATWQAGPVLARVVGQNGHVVGITSDDAIEVTDDGISWTTLRPAAQVVDVKAGPDGFLAYTRDGKGRLGVVLSRDGRTWTEAGSTTTVWSYSMVYAMSRWVMVGTSPGGVTPSSLAFTSVDGVTWQSRQIPSQVLRISEPNNQIYPFGDGFFALNWEPMDTRPNAGSALMHLWWVRPSRAGDPAGSTPEPTAAATLQPASN